MRLFLFDVFFLFIWSQFCVRCHLEAFPGTGDSVGPETTIRNQEECSGLSSSSSEVRSTETSSRNGRFELAGFPSKEAGGEEETQEPPDEGEDEQEERVPEQGAAAPPEEDGTVENRAMGDEAVRGSSLAFIFDSTGSMGDELEQVKYGAKTILEALRDHPETPIHNYIWVPFNDPEVGPVTVTTDPEVFQKSIGSLFVRGGGDCAEMSLGALKKALEVILPNSYVYVFTDAPAKDYRLLNDILSLIQQKQPQIDFIVTGMCHDASKESFTAYDKVAERSLGQIYNLNRKEVKEVLKYVKIVLQNRAVPLLSLKKPAPETNEPDKVNVVVDESLRQFMVSVIGKEADINLSDPKGKNVKGPPKLEKVLTLKNVKVVNVNEPDPGSWSVHVKSKSDYSVKLTGLSSINFDYGFSSTEKNDLKETHRRPFEGAKSFVQIQSSDPDKIYNISTVDFVTLNGDVIQSVELTPVPETPGLFRGGDFTPPQGVFNIGITAFSKDGLPVKRITSTAITPLAPDKPKVTMEVVSWKNNGGSLRCYVKSAIPVTIHWYKNGEFIGREDSCRETCEVNLKLEKVSSGEKYSCKAENVAGSVNKDLPLLFSGDFPSVKVNSPVAAYLGEKVVLDCLVESKLPHQIKWSQFTPRDHHSGILHPVSTGVQLENGSLLIEAAKAEDDGWFVCTATNKAGDAEGRVLLIVNEPVTVKAEPGRITYVEGDSARFVCSASGRPQPKKEWFKDQQKITDEDPSMTVEEINGNLNLVLNYLQKGNAGVYFCNAANAQEHASAAVELIYVEKPTVKAKENNVMVKTGSQVVLRCTATGAPEPEITWLKGDEKIANDSRFQIDRGVLTIESARSSDAGEYSCKATNDLDSDVDYIGLIVGSSPSFLQKPRGKKIQIGHNGTVACSAIGVPPPEIKWTRSDGESLDSSRMSVLPSGALKITLATVADAGEYNCTAENVFGSVWNPVLIKVTGIEKPAVDKSVPFEKVETASGNELIIPCGLFLGNPPAEVKWFKNGIELRQNEHTTIEESGNLVIRNTSAADRGSYLCSAQNPVGNSSRPFEILITESPTIKQTNETGLKAKVGGEIVIPCPVEGFPLPTVVWTRNGLPLPMSSTIFQDERGSLIIRNLSEDNAGVYVCTAINSVGSVSKATTIQVQVPPGFPEEVQESSVNVVEGHVVVLNCNATAVPEPKIHWFKNDEPLLEDENQPKLLRFVANVEDTGVFRCVAENDAGSTSKDFNVTILVPPKILGKKNEESIKAKAGGPITLLCNVFGVPSPTILWQRNGMYLTQNSSDVTILDSGSLTIQNVTKESAGAYTCDAENLGGITQRVFYLQVNYPPKIMEDANASRVITLKEGEEYSLPCLAEGNPKPIVFWRKNGLPIQGHQPDMIVLEDSTLVFLQVTRETTGVYKCEAINTEGSAFKEREIQVMSPPLLEPDFHPTRLEANEGDSLSLTCPTSASLPPSTIQWIKDGEPLDPLLQERSDEAQMKLSQDQRTLTIVEAHPSDRGNYSCVATHLAGRTDARFSVDVLMTPHFEEFNHVAHRTILTGGEVVLNCSVSGNPQPKVTWRKENTSITPYNTPGVHVSLDKQHLTIGNGKVHHSGTYICLATNKVNAKEREFYVTVLEPPQIGGPLQLTVEVMKGGNVTLRCEGSGVPPPTFAWAKEDQTKILLNNTEDYLTITNASSDHGGVYLCDITNRVGTRTKYFQLNVLELPQIENQGVVDEFTNILGGNVTLKSKTRGDPRPEITWLHNGRVLKMKRDVKDDNSKDREVFEEGVAQLTLNRLRMQDGGNVAGVAEKTFNPAILVPPRLQDGHAGMQNLTVIHPFPVILKCPVFGDPTPEVSWEVNGERLREDDNCLLDGAKLRIKKSTAEDSGVYVCLAENPGGRISSSFNVSVIEPPNVSGNQETTSSVLVNDTLLLHCNSTGNGHLKRSWFRQSIGLENSSHISISDEGTKLEISNVQPTDSGVYSCLTSNIAGSVEIIHEIAVFEFV